MVAGPEAERGLPRPETGPGGDGEDAGRHQAHLQGSHGPAGPAASQHVGQLRPGYRNHQGLLRQELQRKLNLIKAETLARVSPKLAV
jgi:hypothetical protein